MLTAVGSLFSFVFGGLAALFRLQARVPIALFLFVAWMWLLFNAPAIYDDPQKMTMVLLAYIVSIPTLFVMTKQPNPLATMPALRFFVVFTFSAILGIVLFILLVPYTGAQAALTTNNVALLATHIMVVAVAEELIFRHGIPSVIPGNVAAAHVLSAFIFGGMHFAAYGGGLATMTFATLLGLLFSWITVTFRDGLVMAVALHATWNAAAMGFLK